MAKDPAFLFYSSDFLSGVMDLDMEERGQYITLLCAQHQKGPLSEKTIRLLVGSISLSVLAKFQQNDIGLFFNARLSIEIENRIAFTESRKINGSKGGRPKKETYEKPSGYALAKASENLPENENENRNTDLIDIEIKEENQKFQSLKKSESIEDRKLKFAETLKPFIEKYGREFLIEFYNYWTEPNKSGKKFRQEDQNFWDLSKRLFTWEKNNKGNSYTNGFQNQPKTIQQDFANSKIGKAMQASQEADFIIDEMIRLKNQKQNESTNSN
jgi:hypothetical protein